MSATGKTLVQFVADGIHADMTSGSATWDELDVTSIEPSPGPTAEGCGFVVEDTTGLTEDGGQVEVIIRKLRSRVGPLGLPEVEPGEIEREFGAHDGDD